MCIRVQGQKFFLRIWCNLLAWARKCEFFVRRLDLECQLGHTYPLFLVASFLLPFQHFTSFLPPGLKPTRATVHSRKRSESFFLLYCANQPTPLTRAPSISVATFFLAASPFLSQVSLFRPCSYSILL